MATAAVSFVLDIQIRYSVQIGSFSSQANAQQALNEAKSRTHYDAFLHENRDLHQFQVRLGPFPGKERAQQVIEDIKTNGYPNAFYVAEDSSGGKLPDLVVRDEDGNIVMKSTRAVQFWSSAAIIEIDNVRYRGFATLLVNNNGRITVINTANMEDYLKGVVPNEIGPVSLATYQALKAQAVAARTYAYKNMKQFDAEGYDLCSTPRCQVYSGMTSENQLTSKAVEETAGEILTYQGQPINALYTSTCGGKTENAEYMFEGWNYPYLKSVECYPEESETAHGKTKLHGQKQEYWLSWVATRTGQSFSGNINEPLTESEVFETTSSLLRYLGKKPCGQNDLTGVDWIHIGAFLVDQLCWQAKRDSLLNEKDYQYFLSRLDFPVSVGPDSHSFLFLFHEGILVPEDGADLIPNVAMSRTEFLKAMFRILQHYRQINSKDGMVREIDDRQIQIVDDTGVHTQVYGNPVFLYQKIGDSLTPRSELVCSAGDTIEYYLDGDQIRILVCEVNRSGISADRSSKYTFWQETFTPEELGQKISKYLDAGDVLDLQPLSYGISGRVYEMKVIGSKTTGILKGIRVRWGLGLRDNLFVVDRILDRSGRVKNFVFTGRGWGHGLGMCQVGALGYAKMGKDYRNILLHYYSGVGITKMF